MVWAEEKKEIVSSNRPASTLTLADGRFLIGLGKLIDPRQVAMEYFVAQELPALRTDPQRSSDLFKASLSVLSAP